MIADYFDKIFCINLSRRTDRWDHAQKQFNKFELYPVERFEGYDKPTDHLGNPNGNMGCTSSHRALLEIIAYHEWSRVLVFEDDFEFRFDDANEQFDAMIKEVPEDWDMLYLGGHYAEKPIRRVSEHVIRMGRMHTTSSYGITWQMARRMAPYICGIGPIDTLYSGFIPNNKCYIFQPRLVVQYSSFSDLTDRDSNNEPCMTDPNHEQMV